MKPPVTSCVPATPRAPGTVLGRLFLLFLLVPIADLSLLVAVGGRIGLVPTLALVVLTAAVGSWLARREGLRAWTQVRHRLQMGQIPGDALLDGLLVFASGVLLLTPGFLTDLAGIAGLLPPTRRWLRRVLTARFGRRWVVAHPASAARPEPGIEDADVVSETVGHNVASARL